MLMIVLEGLEKLHRPSRLGLLTTDIYDQKERVGRFCGPPTEVLDTLSRTSC